MLLRTLNLMGLAQKYGQRRIDVSVLRDFALVRFRLCRTNLF